MERQTSFSLHSPSETPYRTPSSSLSRRSRDYEDMSPSPTPPPLASDVRIVKKRSNESQTAMDESLSPLDPRRFTPTLHASLVSEILSLRRDLEIKTKSIDQLEQTLDAAQTQNDGLSKSLLASNKEVRSVKRQMQLLEGGTLSAISDLSKERDDATREAIDVRKRLEQSQKRAKGHEESADRAHELWEKEKEAWAKEKRILENQKHVVEGRLKSVLEAITQSQAQLHRHNEVQPKSPISKYEDVSNVAGSPTSLRFRNRRESVASNASDRNGGRTSVQSFGRAQGFNLADELGFDDIEEQTGYEDEQEGRISPDALAEERARPSSSCSKKARKVLGLGFGFEELEPQENTQIDTETSHEQLSLQTVERQQYVDSGVQYSPPSSPSQETILRLYEDGDSQSSDFFSTSKRWSGDLSNPGMVSTSCQTVDFLPSPPLTPIPNDPILATIAESPFEKSETKDVCTQTDLQPRPGGNRYIHSRTSTHDLRVPTIAIFPPTSRPATPEGNVVLPPHTKNAGCQVDTSILFNYTSTAMQTEEIRIDKRNIFAPSLVQNSSRLNQTNSATSKGKASILSHRENSQTGVYTSNSSFKRSLPQPTQAPPVNDDGPLALESSLANSRPVRSSSLFAGFDDYTEELEDELDHDIFYDDDQISSRPTAKFTLRSGKLVSQESTLEDIGEISAVNAGEAIALDNLNRAESALPPELRQFDFPESSKNLKRQSTIRRAPSATKQTNVRRTAMISSGVAVHQSKHSQSTIESGSLDGSVQPPIPIPLRYSSARIGKAYSESGRTSRGSSNNTSPTRQYRTKYRPALRKARSGPAISPAGHSRRPRSKSPPLDSRVSIVPEMPLFQMPGQTPFEPEVPLTNDFMDVSYQASAPRPAIATGPRRTHNHLKQVSDPSLLQQTSVVDAIAQTMVGEWMYKYVRRRKSFGKPDKDWDPNKSVEELTNNPTSAGVRHKRWVWLAPYERAVMWSSKQPMNGTALLGKSGRKLTVKSVLDVKDDNPMPKNSLNGPAFNRSILILTPQRALKFTATSQERHFVWLTALSFLSHSPLSIGDLAALPPPPDEFRIPSPPPLPVGGSFKRRTLRDSIRLAKGSNRQENGHRSTAESSQYNGTRPTTREHFDAENDAALPPPIKRFHIRTRSNTLPRQPPGGFMSFSQRDVVPVSSANQNEAASHQRRHYTPSVGNPSAPASRRGSEASAFGRPAFDHSYTRTQPGGFGFSDSSHNASMTMRMDAFIDNKQSGRGVFKNLRLGGGSRATNKDLSYWGIEEPTSPTSPVESLIPANTGMRLSDSTGRGSVERDFFRGF